MPYDFYDVFCFTVLAMFRVHGFLVHLLFRCKHVFCAINQAGAAIAVVPSAVSAASVRVTHCLFQVHRSGCFPSCNFELLQLHFL